MTTQYQIDRRRLIKAALATMAASYLPLSLATSQSAELISKTIPSTGEKIPAIGMGSWMTFNVGDDVAARQNCTQVLKAFFAAGGSLIDSSPMYGSSEEVIGYCLGQLNRQADNFSATKVWTPFQSSGESQIKDSHRLWGVNQIDLFQIHNLVAWQKHLATLRQLKSEKKLRYIGITTSHGRRHADIEKVMATQQGIDFVQLTYNVLDTEVESRLLPLAQEKGIAVIVNRPFQRNSLFQRFAGKPLPKWAGEIDCHSWAQYFLKFIISHPAVTCAIPATSQVTHMQENMAVLKSPLPDAAMRSRMLSYIKTL